MAMTRKAMILREIVKSLDCKYDARTSRRVGYPVYRNKDEFCTYVCNLGDGYEVHYANGEIIGSSYVAHALYTMC